MIPTGIRLDIRLAKFANAHVNRRLAFIIETRKIMSDKKPKLLFRTGREAKEHRQKLGVNQFEFWGRIAVTQSGGSRYESGRDMPKPVQILLHLAYAPEKQAAAMFQYLRRLES